MTRRKRSDTDRTIVGIAGRQHGVVSRGQILAAGVPADAIDVRLQDGQLQRVFRGVYQVGPIAAPRAREMAAALACDGHAVIADRSAGAQWQLVLARPAADINLIVARSDHGRRPGMKARRERTLRPDEVTTLEGIPITTPARTLLDLAACVSPRELERALAEAFARNLTTRPAMLRLLELHPTHRGAAALRALLDAGPALTRSEAEDRFLALMRKARLPLPETNVTVGDYEVDFLWRTHRLVVEIDGFAFHSSVRKFESDRERDAVLAARGFSVIRVTWRQLTTEPEAVLVRLAQALARSGRGD
ncbi:MAG: DUF559 domain-containing protein [Gemmatimonadota bacterium]